MLLYKYFSLHIFIINCGKHASSTGAVRRSYANNNSSSGSVYRGRNSQLINNSVHKAEVRSEPNVNNIETQSTGGSSVSSRIKQFESSKISKIMNKRGFSTKKGGGKSPSGKGVGNSSFNDDWRSGKLLI